MTENRIRDYRKPGEVAKILGIDTDLLRKYTDHFNIQTERSNEDGTGFRKYKDEHIAELKEIVRLIKQEGFSWDQVLAWRNGEEEIHYSHEERSQLEKKIDQYIEYQKEENSNQREHNEKQEQFNLASAQNFDMLMKYVRGLEQKVTGLEQHLLETKTEVKELTEKNSLLEEKITLIEAPKEDKTDKYSEFMELLKERDQQRKKEDEEQQARQEARDRMVVEELKAIKETAATNQNQKQKKKFWIF